MVTYRKGARRRPRKSLRSPKTPPPDPAAHPQLLTIARRTNASLLRTSGRHLFFAPTPPFRFTEMGVGRLAARAQDDVEIAHESCASNGAFGGRGVTMAIAPISVAVRAATSFTPDTPS